jgi:putative hydrolase of the HAD superfamily
VSTPHLPARIYAVFFDAVGTLIHPEPPAGLVYREVGREFGSCRTRDDIETRFAKAFQQEETFDRECCWHTSEERELLRWRHIVRRVLDDVSNHEACFQKLLAHFKRPGAWQCTAEASTTLLGLAKRNYKVGIASNFDQRLYAVLAGKPELQWISHVIISSEVGWRKPASEFFETTKSRCGFAAEDVLHVGDDLANDYEAARTAGLHAILFDPQDKHVTGTLLRIRKLSDLLQILQKRQ